MNKRQRKKKFKRLLRDGVRNRTEVRFMLRYVERAIWRHTRLALPSTPLTPVPLLELMSQHFKLAPTPVSMEFKLTPEGAIVTDLSDKVRVV